jgi:hypothetical protein
MEDVVRLEFTLGRTKLTLTGPQEETDNARILVEGAKDLFIQAVAAETEKSEVLVPEDYETTDDGDLIVDYEADDEDDFRNDTFGRQPGEL